jgi:hypothetical protein
VPLVPQDHHVHGDEREDQAGDQQHVHDVQPGMKALPGYWPPKTKKTT